MILFIFNAFFIDFDVVSVENALFIVGIDGCGANIPSCLLYEPRENWHSSPVANIIWNIYNKDQIFSISIGIKDKILL